MKIRILLFLTLLSSYAFGQALTDAQMTTQVETNIRAITAAGGITKGAVTDAFESLINNKLNKNEVQYVVATGTNTYAATLSPAIASYVAGQKLFVNFTNANGGASTINVNSLGVIAIKKNVSSALVAGDLPAGGIGLLVYDGTNFQLLGVMPVDASGSVKGVLKLYTATGSNTDGAMDQNSTTTALAGKLSGTLSPAHIFVGNGSSVATDLAVTGAISMSSAGVTAYAGDLPVTKLNGGTGASSTTTWAGDGSWKHRFTNAAVNTELIASDGTDGIGSGVFVGSSNIAAGSGSIAGTERTFSAVSSDANSSIRFTPQGSGDITSTLNGTGSLLWYKTNSGTSDIVVHSQFERQSSGTVANGYGLFNSIRLENASGTVGDRVRWNYSLSDAANTSEDILVDLQAVRNGTLSTAWSWNNNNFSFFTNTGSYGGGEKVIFVPNATTPPASSPSAGTLLYSESGDLKVKNTSGTVTNLSSPTASGSGLNLTPTSIKTTSYTAAVGEFVETNAVGGTVPITLPTAPADKKTIGVKMMLTASNNTTTITCGGSDLFNIAGGSTTISLLTAKASVILQYDAANGLWLVMATDAGLSYVPLAPANNLSDVSSASIALQNLGGLASTVKFNTQTGDYTLASTDFATVDGQATTILMNKATGQNLTVPLGLSTVIGKVTFIRPIGAGMTTVIPAGGVTINASSGSYVSRNSLQLMSLTCRALNVYDLDNGSPNVATLPGTSTIGDLLVGSSTGTAGYSNLAAVATGSVLGSTGVATAPAYLSVSDGLVADATSLKFGGTFSASKSVATSSGGLTINGTWTAPANNSYNVTLGGVIGARATTVDITGGTLVNPTVTANASSQRLYGLAVVPTLAVNGQTSITPVALYAKGSTSSDIIFQAENHLGNRIFSINSSTAGTIQIGSSSAAQIEPATNGAASSSGPGLLFSGSLTTANSTGHTLNFGSLNTATIAHTGVVVSGSYAPTSGTTAYTTFSLSSANAINQTSTATGAVTMVGITPAYTSVLGTVTGVVYNPSITSVTGTHYGFVSVPTAALSGVGTATPNSTFQVNGSFSVGYVAKTANYTLTSTDYVVECTANSFTVTLPTAVGITGRIYIIKNTGAGTISLATTSSQTVDGTTPPTVAAGGKITLMANGANYIVL